MFFLFYFQDVLNANETQEFEREFFAFRSVTRVSCFFFNGISLCNAFSVKGNCQDDAKCTVLENISFYVGVFTTFSMFLS